MRSRSIILSTLAVALLSLALAGDEPAAKKEPVAIKGEVIDLRCYAGREAKGAEHAGCAAACIKRGVPAGLLSEKGEIYILIAAGSGADLPALLEGKVGVPVTAKGQLAVDHGVKAFVVESVEKQ